MGRCGSASKIWFLGRRQRIHCLPHRAVGEVGRVGPLPGGQREYIETLARAAVATGVAGLFMEVHQDPERALSSGANAMRLDRLARPDAAAAARYAGQVVRGCSTGGLSPTPARRPTFSDGPFWLRVRGAGQSSRDDSGASFIFHDLHGLTECSWGDCGPRSTPTSEA